MERLKTCHRGEGAVAAVETAVEMRRAPPPCPPTALRHLCGIINVKGGKQKRRHQRQQQKEEGRTTTRTTITRHKGKEQKGNGSKPERCSSCVLWGEALRPPPHAPHQP